MAESVGYVSLTPDAGWFRLAVMRERHVVIAVFPGVQPLDAVGPFEVFAGATRVAASLGRARGYRVTLLLPGGDRARAARRDTALLSWIGQVARTCRRVATVCTGAFLAAEAGLLDGRRVTTHWASADALAAEYPALEVDADPIYVRDGKYWTSAGVTAGIDLALALVQDDLGDEVAQPVARWLVMFLHRPGGKTQFATPVWVPRAERSTVRAVQGLVEREPDRDYRVPVLAAAAGMSVRHFTRVFATEVGETPGRFVERVRMEVARHQLETTDDTLERIAVRCGFGTGETLRRVFRRRLNVSPDSYRRCFRVVTTEWTSA